MDDVGTHSTDSLQSLVDHYERIPAALQPLVEHAEQRFCGPVSFPYIPASPRPPLSLVTSTTQSS